MELNKLASMAKK